MTFTVGAGVVYPGHGAAVVEGIETRTIKGEDRTYLVLRFAHSGMVVHLPAGNVDLIGVRQIIDDDGLEKAKALIRDGLERTGFDVIRGYIFGDTLASFRRCRTACAGP